MILGTISSIDDENGIQVIIDGEDVATTKKYSYIASYIPAEDDRVLIEEIGGSYVILGRIITDTSESGQANYAAIAGSATNANNATNATNAVNAQNATNATNATNAENATKADSATKADTATTATSATKATTATTAETANLLSSTNYRTNSGKLVKSVTRNYNSTLGTYIVTDVELDYSNQNYVYKW